MWYAIEQRPYGLPPLSTKRQICKRQVRRLAGRRALRSSADTQVSSQRSTMEDTADRTVCQTKDFTNLSPSRGVNISVASYRYCEL